MGTRGAVYGLWVIAFVVPPEPGLEVAGSVGGGKYRVVGCAETAATYYNETSYAGSVRYRAESGISVAADASRSTGSVREGPDGPRDGYSVAGRVGWHARYGGGEAGVGAFNHDGKTQAMPSATLWLGLPEVHAFGTLMANRYAVDQGDFTVGIGHSGPWLNASVGAGVQGLVADAEAKIWRHVAPTVSVRLQDHNNWNVAAGLTFRWDPAADSRRE
jgi:hypothetical protein